MLLRDLICLVTDAIAALAIFMYVYYDKTILIFLVLLFLKIAPSGVIRYCIFLFSLWVFAPWILYALHITVIPIENPRFWCSEHSSIPEVAGVIYGLLVFLRKTLAPIERFLCVNGVFAVAVACILLLFFQDFFSGVVWVYYEKDADSSKNRKQAKEARARHKRCKQRIKDHYRREKRKKREQKECADQNSYQEENPYYAMLGLHVDATRDEVRKAYRELAKKYHPDRGGDADKFKQVQVAYEKIILSM